MIASLHFAKAFTIRHDTLLIFYCVRRVMTSLTLRPLPSSSVPTFPLSLGEGRGEDSLSFASKPCF